MSATVASRPLLTQPPTATLRRLQPFPQTTGNQAVLHEADSLGSRDREQSARGWSPATAPASGACGVIDDPRMIERGPRPHEVAHEPDAQQPDGRCSTGYRRPSAPAC